MKLQSSIAEAMFLGQYRVVSLPRTLCVLYRAYKLYKRNPRGNGDFLLFRYYSFVYFLFTLSIDLCTLNLKQYMRSCKLLRRRVEIDVVRHACVSPLVGISVPLVAVARRCIDSNPASVHIALIPPVVKLRNILFG